MDAKTDASSSSIDIFPTDVLKWIKANAKPLMAFKLMQVCKYFKHREFPFLVLKGLSKAADGSWNYSLFGQNKTVYTDTLDIFADKSLWITNGIFLYEKVDPFSSILSKIAVFKGNNLYLRNQSLTIDELKVLASSTSFEFVNIYNTTITDKTNEPIALESLLQILTDVTFLSFDQILPSFSSEQNATNVLVPNLTLFEAHGLRETFNFQTFIAFMKAHPFVQCRLEYDGQLNLSPEYKQQLEEYIFKLVDDNLFEYPPPLISFPEQTSRDEMEKLHQRYRG
uniref:DUF38 domain-containing protein n=1 Tax=Panagrolaimus davidi TaxID=227884 RepID=A0A914QNL2_9BILA